MTNYKSVYPSPIDDTTVNATTFYSADYKPWMALDPALSLTGSSLQTTWYSGDGDPINHKLNVDLGSAEVIIRLVLDNAHNLGANIEYAFKDFTIYGTNSATAFANTDYADITDLTLLGTFQAAQHVMDDIADPQYFVITNSTAYRYYVFRFSTGYSAYHNGIRHIELQKELEQTALSSGLDANYGDFQVLSGGLAANYKNFAMLAQDLIARWENVPVLLAGCRGLYGDMAELSRALNALYGSAAIRAAAITLQYHLNAGLTAGLDARYPILEGERTAAVTAMYDLMLREPLVAGCVANWAILSGEADIKDYGGLYVIVGNSLLLSWTSLKITEDESSTVVTVEIELASINEYKQIMALQPVTVFDGETVCHLLVDDIEPTAARSGADDVSEGYSLTCRSKGALMTSPHSLRYDMGWTDTMASVIAQEIADLDGLTVDWQVIDYPVASYEAAQQTAMEMLSGLIEGVAIIQSEPNGTLTIRPKRETSWDDIASAAPGVVLDAEKSWNSYSITDDQAERYNLIRVSDGQGVGISLETINQSPGVDLERAYQVPFVGGLGLQHSGGADVLIESMGIQTEKITADVEFVDGKSSVTKPVYSAVTADWGDNDNLGTITAQENGSLSVADANGANSLATVTYTTKYQQWRVTYNDDERTQVWIEETEA